MNFSRRSALRALGGFGLLMAGGLPAARAHGQHGHGARELGTGAALGRDGRLWVVGKETAGQDQYVVLQHTSDLGKTWSAPRRIQQSPEPVAAGGEARPHIALGADGEIYISYTSTVARPHIGDIRFVRSLDGGKTFSAPLTVNTDRSRVTHSFESMVVDPRGRIFIAWIDGRDADRAKRRKEKYAGSAVYYAVSSDHGASFGTDRKLANHSCECCRIALTLDAAGKPVAAWRHVFAPNIRDHAMAELGGEDVPSPARVTFDDWRIDACPHHGPSLAFGADGRRHLAWFNGREGDDAGAWYGIEAPAGGAGSRIRLGDASASHPDVAVAGNRIAVVWKAFDGKAGSVLGRISADGGKTWRQAELARAAGASDKPCLVSGADALLLVWRTQDEGIRVVPLV
ncbi:sialidase family protein [Noviherbaspirillum aridicola]|uniref:Lipoprotein n=1 Tax=Noviherbaspirillum aridicola TaxID=2849687 RepID=A0ABQ4Q803_9BURK|nr:sialidase family protein [Noviherbaspirillum aridicola]GIZ53354.1 lipoprotein [Noviherbaspirillum aridicola]